MNLHQKIDEIIKDIKEIVNHPCFELFGVNVDIENFINNQVNTPPEFENTFLNNIEYILAKTHDEIYQQNMLAHTLATIGEI